MKKSVRKSRKANKANKADAIVKRRARGMRNPNFMRLAHCVADTILDPEVLLEATHENEPGQARALLEQEIRADWDAKGLNKNTADEESGLYEEAMFYIGVAIGKKLGGVR
jgi:hypothetical protein